MLSPGDIYWIEFPKSAGHEQSGRRPAVILQDDLFGSGLPLVILVPLTTAERAGRFAGTISISPDESNGLRRQSFVLVFQIRAVDKLAVKDRIGIISTEHLSGVHHQLDLLLGRETGCNDLADSSIGQSDMSNEENPSPHQ
jgi:mRNA interferase MazF